MTTTYYLPEELFSIVKEFAGIYNMKTTLSKIHEDNIMKAFEKISYWRHLKWEAKKFMPPQQNRMSAKAIKKYQLNYIYERKWTYDIAKHMEKLCLPSVDKKYQVGDEISYSVVIVNGRAMAEEECGVITKINDYSIQFKPYQLETKTHYLPLEKQVIDEFNNNPYNAYYESQNNSPPRTNDNTTYQVNYYDKSKFKRAKTIKDFSFLRLMKKQNHFTPLWNSENDLSKFVCVKSINWRSFNMVSDPVIN